MRVFSAAIFGEDNLVSIERSNLPARIQLYILSSSQSISLLGIPI